MPFKTTIKYPNYQPLPQESLDIIVNWVEQQITAGKNTGDSNTYYNTDGTIFIVERWQWSDEAVCQEYFALINSLTSDPNTDIVTEIVTI